MSDQEAQASQGNERTQNAKHSEQRKRGGSGDRERSRHRRASQPHRPERLLNMDELRDLIRLLAEYGFTDFEFENEDFRVRLGRGLEAQAPAGAANDSRATSQSTEAQGAAASSPAAAVAQSQAGVQSGAQQSPATPHPGAQAQAAASEDEELHIITSPIVGTFYRLPSPTAEPFVRLGSHVNPETTVCIIEAMKLMNEIQAETSGEVAKIYVENGQPVEYGQPLFGIKK